MNESAYAAPATLSEVSALLSQNPGARVLAGGQHLLIEPSRSQLAGVLLVDLRKVPKLAGIEAKDGGVRIGAMTTLAHITANELIHKTCPVLGEAAGLVGDAQVRNRATIGGAIAEADPGSDLIPVLLVLGAGLEIAGSKTRQVAVDDYFAAGAQKPSPSEVIAAVSIPRPAASTGFAYEKMKHPATLYALCGVAAAITLSSDGGVTACRIAVTGSTEQAARLRDVETALTGSKVNDTLLADASRHAGSELAFRGDVYASAEYRAHVTRVFIERAVRRAAERAKQQV